MKTYLTALLIVILFLHLSCKDGELTTICDTNFFTENVYQIVDETIGVVTGIIQNQDGSFVTLGHGRVDNSFDFQLTKLSENLEPLWVIPFGGNNDEFVSSIIKTIDGGFLLCGYTNSFGQGGSDIYIIKTDNNGEEEWSNTYGTLNNDRSNAVLQLDDESYVIAGLTTGSSVGSFDEYIIKIDSEGNEIWSQINSYSFKDEAVDLQKTSDGNMALLSIISASNGLDADLVVTKLDDDGNVIWKQNIGTSAASGTRPKLINTNDNHLLIASSTAEGINLSSSDFLLIKINEDGETQWTNSFGNTGREVFSAVIETANNEYLILGTGPSCGNDLSDIHLSKVNATGDLIWLNIYGKNVYEASNTIIKTANNTFLIAGHVQGQNGGSDYDLILIKTDSNGSPQ